MKLNQKKLEMIRGMMFQMIYPKEGEQPRTTNSIFQY